ncbi:uncharacterized protein LY89DRAFT_635992 [Mollisia scopiformis]|uniref:Integral membrane protein TmpA n=1 Tax=Mollisia scopiformis TaxID=149040 RepID=A0A194XV98_MOLSC|nr:uncharacterized protein LY89DRAFT_635992 [Mollisia scopiformis]KUJ23637.1 hypothetical protein LY89DRAFT_635992 [Mollisia scopiformis]
MWREASRKDGVTASTLPTTFDIDVEKGVKHASHASYSSCETLFLEKDQPLPQKKYSRSLRHARHTFLNVYRRLFSIVFVLNLIGLGVLYGRYRESSPPAFMADLANAASANIMVVLLVRQDYVVNALFRLTWIIPLTAPLRLRRILTKVYEYGGVHSGAAISSVTWFSIFTGYLTKAFIASGPLRSPAILTLTYLLLLLLLILCITAYPRFRFSSHNTFENLHRWGGWFSLALFWAELCLFANTQVGLESLGTILIKLPAFWFLLVSSLHAIYPWLRFHKLHVRPEKLSDHAIRLHFDEKVPLFVGLRISDAPLREWHSFACIPAREGQGGSVLISNAGDWTKKTIQNPRPYYWVKGVPVTGVLCMARIFKRVVVVTTGSGIGPVLAVVQDVRDTKCRVIWSTPDPLKTYGASICNAVQNVDPNAVIIDTRKERRPDLVTKAWDLYVREKAEAVFVISNPKLTRKVVYGLESRGVPCFGPIWDS